MKSIKAILAGSLFIFLVLLLIQLAMVFLAVGYNFLVKSYPVLQGTGIYFRYVLGYPLFLLVLFVGGYITASIAKTHVMLHCFVTGVITIGLSTYAALEYMEITTPGVFVIVFAILTIIAGGRYWQKKQCKICQNLS